LLEPYGRTSESISNSNGRQANADRALLCSLRRGNSELTNSASKAIALVFKHARAKGDPHHAF
jgi:hypothetical protein